MKNNIQESAVKNILSKAKIAIIKIRTLKGKSI